MMANSRCNAACPCGDTKAKGPFGRTGATLIMACWAALPTGAITSIITGDLRSVGVGLVLALTATGYGMLRLEGHEKAQGTTDGAQ